MKESKRLVIGIVADVDAGKTTLSEEILHKAGIIKEPGRVDRGDAFLDRDEIERRRGITVFAKEACFSVGERQITLLDTPGHMDLREEVKRSLSVLDLAIFLLDGSSSISGHSLRLWRELEKLSIPTVIAINKVDLPGFNKEEALKEVTSLTAMGAEYSGGFNQESLIFSSDDALDIYEKNKGNIPDEEIRKLIEGRRLFPIVFTAALKGEGVDNLLNLISDYAPIKNYPEDFGAIVFKIGRSEKGKKLCYIKITGGELKIRSEINGEKITSIMVASGLGYTPKDTGEAGEVLLVTGLDSAYSGMGLGIEKDITVDESKLITYEVILPEGADYYSSFKSLKELGEEFPELGIESHEDKKISMSIYGDVQQEIIKELIERRYGLKIEYGKPRIEYRETIEEKVYGAGHYEPLKHYAEVHLLLEPGERGSGIIIKNQVSQDDLDLSFIKAIMESLENHRFKGVLIGAELTDTVITLIDGRGHLKHTEGGDFREAGIRAYRQALMKGKSRLLEPYMSTSFSGPAEILGRIASDIRKMKGEINEQLIEEAEFKIDAVLPLVNLMEYRKEYISITGGRGRIESEFLGFLPCHNEEEIVSQYGYDSIGDLEFPSASVFCVRGAANLVPWNEADEAMHIRPLDLRREDREGIREGERSEVSIKELEEIFNRTFGSGNKPRPRPSKIIKAEDNSKYKGKEAGINNTVGERHLLVDGYNVIFRWKELKELADINMDGAREKLIGLLANYGAYTGEKVTVVFDAYKNKNQESRRMEVLGIDVVFTKENETADTYIEREAFERGKKERLRVATSDRLEQMNVFGSGALRISALELKALIEDASREIREILNG